MATATVKTEVKVTGVTLELTSQEATVIRDLMQVVGGSSLLTRRGFTDRINRALKDAGVKRTTHTNDMFAPRADDLTGTLYFT